MHFLVISTLLSLAAAAPTYSPRNILAGGPAITPIPSNCTLEDITPDTPTTAFKLTDTFSSAHSVFSMYLPSYYNVTQGQLTCLEQCYGYGNPEQCVAALWAQNVTYEAYGYTNVGNACLMYGADISSGDLEAVGDGEYVGARATNIRCPSPRNP